MIGKFLPRRDPVRDDGARGALPVRVEAHFIRKHRHAHSHAHVPRSAVTHVDTPRRVSRRTYLQPCPTLPSRGSVQPYHASLARTHPSTRLGSHAPPLFFGRFSGLGIIRPAASLPSSTKLAPDWRLSALCRRERECSACDALPAWPPLPDGLLSPVVEAGLDGEAKDAGLFGDVDISALPVGDAGELGRLLTGFGITNPRAMPAGAWNRTKRDRQSCAPCAAADSASMLAWNSGGIAGPLPRADTLPLRFGEPRGRAHSLAACVVI